MSRCVMKLGAPGILFLLVCVLVCGASCAGPNPRVPALAAKPGWGGVPVAGRTLSSVRAVEAALRPEQPPTRLGKPGWGR